MLICFIIIELKPEYKTIITSPIKLIGAREGARKECMLFAV